MENLKVYESFGPGGSENDYQERIDLLMEAQDGLRNVITLIKKALMGTSQSSYANAYIIKHLENWVDSEGRYDMGIQQFIDRLEEEGQYEDEEEEDFE